MLQGTCGSLMTRESRLLMVRERRLLMVRERADRIN